MALYAIVPLIMGLCHEIIGPQGRLLLLVIVIAGLGARREVRVLHPLVFSTFFLV